MLFWIADTISDKLTKLAGQEQKAVITTAFDLQMNHASPVLRFHELEKATNENFLSVSVSMDILFGLTKPPVLITSFDRSLAIRSGSSIARRQIYDEVKKFLSEKLIVYVNNAGWYLFRLNSP